MTTSQTLQQTINDMVDGHRGILAADESNPTIAKRFAAIKLESTEDNRRAYRSLLLETPDLGQYICGVILFEETLGQKNANGIALPELAWQQKIVPGIKVDKGTEALSGAPGDLITKGLDGLAARLKTYSEQGARFAKWREVYNITPANPTPLGLHANAERLAHYAAICQQEGIVPIVEPEILMDGNHDIERCAEVSEQVLHAVFNALFRFGVTLEHIILKPNMVAPGKDCRVAPPEEIAAATLRIFRRTVPAAVASINFLSGGMTPQQATANLGALNKIGGPWPLSTSYGRALQQPVLEAWKGDAKNVRAAQTVLMERARLNSLARLGKFTASMDTD
jgi:fructose-bisphosphate aldolase, class I